MGKDGQGLLGVLRHMPDLKQVVELVDKIQEENPSGYAEIVLMENLDGVCVLDEKGRLSYDNFVSHIVA